MQVKIEKLVYGGEGLARAEGQTIFVPFVLPDELVEIRPVERKKKFLRGRLERVVEPSAQRAEAPCPYFTVCGGCHYQHMPYEQQLDSKAEILRETLRRLGRIEWPGEIVRHASPPFGYRNRAQWKVRRTGDRLALGYNQAGSGALCAIERCPILAPALEEAITQLNDLLAHNELPDSLTEVEAFVDHAGERLLLNAAFARFDPSANELAEVLREALPQIESLLLHDAARDEFALYGPGYIHYQAAGARYRVGHLSFFQVNRFLTDAMVQLATGDAAGTLVLDLYAGVGLFTLPLAERFARVVAVEANPAAVRDLESNVEPRRNAVQPVTAEAENFLAGFREAPDLVVLDPPRAGAAEVIPHLARLAPPRIHYLSCDPATLARDMAALSQHSSGAYEIAELHLVDVFPQSFHIETLVKLVRRP